MEDSAIEYGVMMFFRVPHGSQYIHNRLISNGIQLRPIL